MDPSNFVEISSIFLKFRRNFVDLRQNFVGISSKCPVSGSPPELCDWWWLPAAFRRPQKKHTPGFLEYVSSVFSRSLLIVYDFTGLKVPPELCDWWWLPAALRRPQKKTRPWIFGACIFWI
jgi:hypothetical protein